MLVVLEKFSLSNEMTSFYVDSIFFFGCSVVALKFLSVDLRLSLNLFGGYYFELVN